VVEIGGRNVNGSVRELFHPECAYLSTDIAPGDGVDIVADGASLSLDIAADLVVCCEVLEHASNADAVVAIALSEGHLFSPATFTRFSRG
jgi:hypothetical protein